ncbi:MAG: FHA domain-containing protein [Chloroflexi bacterium]|nr:FHA domain-containing protein [Chloroflexota bacterium]
MNGSSSQQPPPAASGDAFTPRVAAAARLVVRRDGVIERRLVLGQVAITVGRALSNDLVLSHEGVSRRHAEIHPAPGGVTVTDLGSANGTYVGGDRLAPYAPRLLTDGAFCVIGPYTVTYYAPGTFSTVSAMPVADP